MRPVAGIIPAVPGAGALPRSVTPRSGWVVLVVERVLRVMASVIPVLGTGLPLRMPAPAKAGGGGTHALPAQRCQSWIPSSRRSSLGKLSGYEATPRTPPGDRQRRGQSDDRLH